MKYLLACLLLSSGMISAQDSSEAEVQQAIIKFFEGFHQNDSLKIRATTVEKPILQTIAITKQGDTIVKTEDFGSFLKSICRIPDTLAFREVIKDFRIRVDGPMANAWTPYEFWLNESFSHCGVNSFQLVRQEGEWKIFYLIDTRRKDHCP